MNRRRDNRGKKLLKILLATILLSAVPACHTLDQDRIPPVPVRIIFNTVADWNIYGTPSALDHRSFIKKERIPANFPYTAVTETGFGGVLLCGDVYGAPVAYDLACPVEMKPDIRVSVPADSLYAECQHCHSRYDIFSNYGHPLSGPAAQQGYGLRRYYVGAGPAGEYMVVSQ